MKAEVVPEAILEANDLAYATPLGEVLAEEIHFRLPPGGILLITGPNGSGKSTLLRVLLKQLVPMRGIIRCSLPAPRIQIIPQMQNLEFHLPMTLLDLLQFSVPGPLSLDAVRSVGLLEETQLGVSWNTASGGERQRALLTRALLQNPQLLFLDEPLNHLDPASQKSLLGKISEFLEESTPQKPHGVVLVSHAALQHWKGSKANLIHLDLDDFLPKEPTS